MMFSLPPISQYSRQTIQNSIVKSLRSESNNPIRFQGVPIPSEGLMITEGSTCSQQDLEECGEMITRIDRDEFDSFYGDDFYKRYMGNYINVPRSYTYILRERPKGLSLRQSGPVVATGTIGPTRDPKVAYIPTLFLESQYRGKGLGEAILRNLIEKAIEYGYEKVTLGTSKELAPFLYKKVGFNVVHEFHGRKEMELDLKTYRALV
jgi:ribosomal protein S18 acetylase RimI-like enzyme